MSDDDEVFFEAINESASVQPTAKVWNRVLGVEGRLELDEQLIAAVENDSRKLLRAVVAILSHAIRRQHLDRKSTRLNSSHEWISRMPSSA